MSRYPDWGDYELYNVVTVDDEEPVEDEDDICPYCKGTGRVTPTSNHHPKQLVLGNEDCEACDGTGHI